LKTDVDSLCQAGHCLEIGPASFPLLPVNNTFCHFADHMTKRGLEIKYRNDPNVKSENIPYIEYVKDGAKTFQELTSGRRFKLIVGSHVIEHVPNPISWLNELSEILEDAGIIRLAVPDKRYCFDFRRRLTSRGELIGRYLEGRLTNSAHAVYDHHAFQLPYYNVPNWEPQFGWKMTMLPWIVLGALSLNMLMFTLIHGLLKVLLIR
jgi:Methyltransferase domain